MVDYTTNRAHRPAPGGGFALFTVCAIAGIVLALAALDSRTEWPSRPQAAIAAE